MPVLPIAKMAKTVMRSLFGGSACKMYPVRPPVFYAGTRGPVEIDTSLCILCGLCAKKCPGEALAVDREKKTWVIDRLKCIVCGLCVEYCPKDCLALRKEYSPPTTGESKELFNIEVAVKKE